MKFRRPRFKDHCDEPDILPEYGAEELEENEYIAKFGWGWRAVYILFAISAVVYLFAVFNPEFADFMCFKIGSVVRYILAIPTNFLPFSFAELLLILLIPIFVAVIIIASRWHCMLWRNVWAFSGKILSVALVILILFVWGFGTGYHGTTLDRKLGLDKQNVSEDELYELTVLLTEKVNSLTDEIEYLDTDFSGMPYSRGEMNDRLLEAYEKVSDTYTFIPRMYSKVKPVMMSELMSYTHITGVYSFFTGEANINIAFPDYTIPYTAAHELAHQRGIAREDEANFVAFLVCTASDDTYIQYSGYLNMLEYVTSAYARAVNSNTCYDFTKFSEMMGEHPEVKAALDAYREKNGEVKKYTDLLAAMEADEALKSAIESNEELNESLGFYKKRAESVDRYNSVRYSLAESVLAEQRAYSKFFEKYQDNIAATISGTVNNTYLQMQGTAGTVSYGMVVDLAVAYYKAG